MREVWQMTAEEFVGRWPVRDDDPGEGLTLAEKRRRLAKDVLESARGWLPLTLRAVPHAPGYHIAETDGGPGDVALVRWCAAHGRWDLVGGYVDSSLWVREDARGMGLGAELVLARADLRDGFPAPGSYTTAGRAAHVAAHRLCVERALAAGMRVPGHVLAEHLLACRSQAASASMRQGAG